MNEAEEAGTPFTQWIEAGMFSRIGFCLGLAALLALAGPARAQSKGEPSRAKLGEKIANVTLVDAEGKKHQLHDLRGHKAIVLVFMSFECPVSNSYCEPLVEMAKEFGEAGVAFRALTVQEDDTREQVAKHAKDFNLTFPVFKDEGLRCAQAVEADNTPEAFVLDGDFILRYRGRIDDSYRARLKKHAEVQRHDLRQALAELLTGRPVAVPTTLPVGCPIARERRPAATVGKVTYHRDVAPILQKNCQTCHRPGEVGPFALTNYKQAVNWAEDIKTFTQSHAMPPWKPSAGVPFQNERKLAEQDIATLAAWVEQGTPEGDAGDAPPPAAFPEGWQLGTPDLVLSVQDDYVLGPTGRDVFRCFVLPTQLPEDVHVSAVELRPGNPRVVHHVLLFIDTLGQARRLEAVEKARKPSAPAEGHGASNPSYDKGPGYSVAMGIGILPQGGLSGWAPGSMPKYLPDGVGYKLPKGSDVVMQVHYHRNGRVEKDRTQLGLYFARKKVDRILQTGTIPGVANPNGVGPLRLFFTIPAGAEHFKLQGDSWATEDFTLYTLSPHMHMLGKSIKLTLTEPDDSQRTLIAIDDWDYNWQESYTLKEPLHIKAGSRLHVEATYDNSSNNPRNPFNPPRRITFGEQTDNEMCFMFLGGTSSRAGGRLPLSSNAPAKKTAAR